MNEQLRRWHQPWRFVIPRWFTCWRKTRHHERAFMGGGRRWTECYCGLRCFEVTGGPSSPAGGGAK